MNDNEEPSAASAGSVANHDAAPAAIADLPDERPPNAVSASGGTPCAASRDGSGTGKQPAPPCVETDGFSHDSRTGQINRTPECESPRRECWESPLRDVSRPDTKGKAAGGPEPESPIDVEELLGELHYIAGSGDHVEYDIRRTACEAEHAIDRLRAWVNELQLSKAEIDALRRVVENGRFIDMSDYGRLRSLLVRLRPEWECESDRSKPISDERLAALDELSALDQELELKHGIKGNPMIKAQQRKAAKTDTTQPRNGTPAKGSVQGDGSVPDSRNANEPVAWAVMYPNGEFGILAFYRREAEDRATASDRVVPLYRSPTLTDAEREAVEWFACYGVDRPIGHSTTLRGLLERLGN